MSRRCAACGHQLNPRRWWQWGPLSPLPLCSRRDAVVCYRRALGMRW